MVQQVKGLEFFRMHQWYSLGELVCISIPRAPHSRSTKQEFTTLERFSFTMIVNESMRFSSLGMDLLFFFFFKCLGIKFDIAHSHVITVLLLGVIMYEGYIDPTD